MEGRSADWVEVEELAVGLKLEDVARADVGKRYRRPDDGQGAGYCGRPAGAEYVERAVAVGIELLDGLLARERIVAVVADEDVAG